MKGRVPSLLRLAIGARATWRGSTSNSREPNRKLHGTLVPTVESWTDHERALVTSYPRGEVNSCTKVVSVKPNKLDLTSTDNAQI